MRKVQLIVSGLLVCALLVVCLPTGAESFARRLKEGHALLRSGDADGALQVYRDLQIEEPESDQLHYSIGCAQYERGIAKSKEEAYDEAIAGFDAARGAFAEASLSGAPAIRRNALFNKANSIAQTAKQAVVARGTGLAQEDHEKMVKAFEESVQAYDQFLEQYPGHAGAKQNLDHVRYLLKKLMQNPPPPEEEQSQGQQDQQQQGGQQQQRGEEQQEQDQGDRQESPEDQQESPGDQDEQQVAQARPQEGGQEVEEKQDRQNTEAILESLEDIDRQEQRERRQGPRDDRLRSEWW